MEKILTIVIPTYNMEKYLDRCLSSLVVEPDWMDRLEVLVVNDGSKDRSSAIAHGYESKYPRTFKVIDKENGNYGSCINAALPIATGKYIKILDADDWFENDNIPEYLDFLTDSDVDFVVSHTYDRNAANEVVSEISFPSLPDTVFNLLAFSEKDMTCLYMHSITYRLAKLHELDYRQLEHISYTDLQWATEPMTNASIGSCFHKVIYNYFKGREGQTVNKSTHCKNMWMEEKVILHIVETVERKKDELSEMQQKFLDFRVSDLINQIYRYYLYECTDLLDEKELHEFDNQLKCLSPQLYKSTNESILSGRIFRFYYVVDWRKKRTRNTLKFWLFDAYCRLRLMLK